MKIIPEQHCFIAAVVKNWFNVFTQKVDNFCSDALYTAYQFTALFSEVNFYYNSQWYVSSILTMIIAT